MKFDLLSRLERSVLITPERGILYQRIDAVLIGLCATFIAGLLIGAQWSGGGLSTQMTAWNVVLTLVLLACAGIMLASLNGIWRGDVNAMLVAWIALAVTLVLKVLSLTLTLGMQIDGAVFVLVVTGLITMRAMLARGFNLSRTMEEPAALRP